MKSILSLNTDNRGKILEIQIATPIEIVHKYDQWAAYSPELKTFGYSAISQQEAMDKLSKSIRNFFKFHIKHDSLDAALKSFNWRKSDGHFNGVFDHFPTQSTPLNISLQVA